MAVQPTPGSFGGSEASAPEEGLGEGSTACEQ